MSNVKRRLQTTLLQCLCNSRFERSSPTGNIISLSVGYFN